MELRRKSIVVTGGANGIGRCLVDRLVEAEARVGVLDHDAEGLARLAQALPQVHCVRGDVTRPAEVASAIDDFLQAFGAIDALVNNAGMICNSLLGAIGPSGLRMHDVATWDTTIAANLSSVFYVTVNVVAQMISRRTRGVIVNVSSICAAGNIGQTAYSAAKAGVDALTVTWAKELGLFGIRVAGIAPGFTETEAVRRSMAEGVIQEWVRVTPLRRMARPEEVADGIVFILRSDAFNGRTLELDLGLRL